MDTPLRQFVQHARAKGMDLATIRMVLLSAGWKDKDVARALTDESLELAVPLPPEAGGAREAFLHLLTFSALLATLGALTVLFFTFINRLFPDPALDPAWLRRDIEFSSIRWSMAIVMVAFPVFLWVSRLVTAELERHPEKAPSGIRQWISYLALFLAAGALAGDMISLLYVFLEGDITTRFLLKVLLVLVLAGATFLYYLLSLRLPSADPKIHRVRRGLLILAITLAATAVVWGVVVVGSPALERQRKFDQRRVADLKAIAAEIHEIVFEIPENVLEQRVPQHPLPTTLEEILQHATDRELSAVDPETGQPYRYVVTGEHTFQLCATFATPRDWTVDIFWNHPAGEHCYAFNVLDWP